MKRQSRKWSKRSGLHPFTAFILPAQHVLIYRILARKNVAWPRIEDDGEDTEDGLGQDHCSYSSAEEREGQQQAGNRQIPVCECGSLIQ